MTIWKPDTCDCIIDYENKKMINKCCTEHKTMNDIVKHNQLFNYRYGKGKELTKIEIQDLNLAKRQEKMELRKGDHKNSITHSDVDKRIEQGERLNNPNLVSEE